MRSYMLGLLLQVYAYINDKMTDNDGEDYEKLHDKTDNKPNSCGVEKYIKTTKQEQESHKIAILVNHHLIISMIIMNIIYYGRLSS